MPPSKFALVSQPMHPANIGRFAFAFFFVFMCFCGFSWELKATPDDSLSLAKLYAPISFITGAWFCLWYVFLFHQSYTHSCAFKGMIIAVKKEGTKERISETKVKAGLYECTEVSVVNTTVRNTLEQSLTFIPLLWACAVLGNDGIEAATRLGWLWVLTRAYYPIVWAMGPPWFFWSTLPGLT